MKKKVLFAAFALMHCMSALAFSVVAPTGQTLYYRIKSSSTVELVAPYKIGTDPEGDEYFVWTGYIMPTGALSIPENVTDDRGNTYQVTSIGPYAFAGCNQLTSVQIPESVKEIRKDAFSNCDSLESILIPNSVIRIGNSAFCACSALVSVDIPNSVVSIGKYAFSRCTNLSTVSLGESLSSIGIYAFQYCTSLSSITFPRSLRSLGARAFFHCENLANIEYNAEENVSIIEIPNMSAAIEVFYYTAITDVNFGEHVKSIPGGLFQSLRVTSIVIPDSVVSIGQSAFANNSYMTSITFGSSVSTMSNSILDGCQRLSDVYMRGMIPPNITQYCFEGMSDTIALHVPCGAVEAYRTSPWGEFFSNIQCDGGSSIANDIDNGPIHVSVSSGQIEVENADGNTVTLYDAMGRQMAVSRNEYGTVRFDIPASGTYLVKVGSAPARRIVVVR